HRRSRVPSRRRRARVSGRAPRRLRRGRRLRDDRHRRRGAAAGAHRRGRDRGRGRGGHPRRTRRRDGGGQPSEGKIMSDDRLRTLTRAWFVESCRQKYSYRFSWMGRPIIQYPQDIIAMQELIWRTRPDLIVETGIAHGGSLVFYASMLELLGGDRRVVG